MSVNDLEHITRLEEDFEDFFEHSLNGYVITSADGKIERVNGTLAAWLNKPAGEFRGKLFSSLLSVGGRIYYETHLGPLLRMRGSFDEVAVELRVDDAVKLPVLINAIERRNADNIPLFTRFTVFNATDRRVYEQNLKRQQLKLETNLLLSEQLGHYKEQFIAVLGHDLRNPVGSILAAAGLLASSPSKEVAAKMALIIRKSAMRMSELIANTMDFARTRLGEGIVLDVKPTLLKPVIEHIIHELQSTSPTSVIHADINLPDTVNCDNARIEQLLSNLLANAITHGATDQPVTLKADILDNVLRITVCNGGEPIDPVQLEEIFQPFRREQRRISQNGLGLGLYISFEIAKAHNGLLTVTSTSEKTCFTFTMPLIELSA